MTEFSFEGVSAMLALQQLVSNYWNELDSNAARNITDFYAEDCRFSAGTIHDSTGRAGVRKFYDERAHLVRDEKGGIRTTRHTSTNLRISLHEADRATLDFVLINYSGAGAPPIGGFEGPTMVSDVRMECRREGREWRIVSFRGTPIFVGDEPFTQKVLARK